MKKYKFSSYLLGIFSILLVGINNADTIVQSGYCDYLKYEEKPTGFSWQLILNDQEQLEVKAMLGGYKINSIGSVETVSSGYVKIREKDEEATQVYIIKEFKGPFTLQGVINNIALRVPHKDDNFSELRAEDIISIKRTDKKAINDSDQTWLLYYKEQNGYFTHKADLKCSVTSIADPNNKKGVTHFQGYNNKTEKKPADEDSKYKINVSSW